MKIFIALFIVAVALSGAECGIISTIGGWFGSGDKNVSSSTVAPVATSSIAPPCVPETTLSPTLEALQDHLPAEYAALLTPKNVEALGNVGELAQLATSAATGNPIAIVKLVMFIAGPKNPIPAMVDMGKEIVPLLTPDDLIGNFRNMTSTAATNLKQDAQAVKEKLTSFFNIESATTKAPTTVVA